MAKVFAPPAELPVPYYDYKDVNYDWREHDRLEEEWVEKLREFCKEKGQGALAGFEVNTGVGDGYARYMVFKENPLLLIHMPVGDAWTASAIWERGLRLKDVREMAQHAELRKLKPLFGISKQ